MTSNFTHLHVHTHYSLLDGLGKIDDILDKVQELGMDSIAITDHGTMYGVPEFYEKATKHGIKPIIGCEFYVAPEGMENKRNNVDTLRYHLVLLARNNVGYKNLMKLTTEAHLRGFYYKPRIDLALLKKYADGLIGMTACIEGEIPSLVLSGKYNEAKKKALEYQDILGKENFYLELQHLPNLHKQKKANDGLIKISEETGIPLVATADIHYVNPEDNFVQDILVCIQTNRKIADENRLSMMENKLYIKSPQEMYEYFKETPQALENTQKIAEKCNVTIEFGNTKLPFFEVPDGFTPDSYLRKLCDNGLKERYPDGNISEKHLERMNYELEIIAKMGFSSYFLIVQDFVNWAKKQKIVVGPGRGSAAGSFVSYLVGITNLDPIEYKLLFERFLNPDRISMPDVDMDFADHRRDEVLAYVRRKYGNDHVAQIITFGTLAARAAIRDAGRVLGVEYSYCDKLAKMVPMLTKLKVALENTTELIQEYNNNPDGKKIIDAALRLEGVARHASMHACGVVITHKPVVEYSPLQYMTGKEGTDEGIVTQYSASSKSSYVEKIGLLKMDFLGLRNLTIIENALKIISKTTGDEISIDKIALNDKETFELLQRGDTTGIFQLESSGMKRYLRQLEPSNLEDLIAMVALYRPGPMEWIPDFISGKHGRRKVSYLHPKLKPILERTYGVAVYQEQVMEIAREIAGFTPGEADVLRKAMGKKIIELIQEEKKKFIQGCVNNDIDEDLATKIFAFIEPFAGYGFNRCLTGDTIITDDRTGKLYRLSEMMEKYQKGQALPCIATLSNNNKLTRGKITKVFDNGKKNVYQIITRSGRKIKATANHPFLTIGGWRLVEKLSPADRIAVPRRLSIAKKPYPIKDYRLIVLGYLMAEGNLCHPQSFYFYSKDKSEIKDYSKNLEKFNNTKATINSSKPTISIYAGRKNLNEKSEAVEWISKIGIKNKKAINKELPDFVFQLDQKQTGLLVAKMFQGDGCINFKRKYPQIFYATSSEKLAQQMQHLLLKLDILSTIHKKRFKYRGDIKIGYTVSIDRYNNILKFSTGPGNFLIGNKKETLTKIVEKHLIINGTIKENSARGSKDVIPSEILSLIRNKIEVAGFSLSAFAQKFGLAPRLFHQNKKKVGYLRETLQIIARALKDKDLTNLAHSDIYWDEIVEIKSIGKEQTYDLTIANTHNFVADGFIVHNSHAACYAMIGYQTAYLKAHYPSQFMAALMNSDKDDTDRIAIEIEESRNMNIEVLPPDVNESFKDFAVIMNSEKIADSPPKIRFGLEAIKGVGQNIAGVIIEERKTQGSFKDIIDLIERVQNKDLNKKSIEALAMSGALDNIAERNQVIENMEIILNYSKENQKNSSSGQSSLFSLGGENNSIKKPSVQLKIVEPASKKQCLSWEKQLLGLYISDHPLRGYQEYFSAKATPIRQLDSSRVNQQVTVGGIITKIQKVYTRNNQLMYFATMEDGLGKIEILVFPKTLEKNPEIWEEEKIILAKGRLSNKDNEYKLLCESALLVDNKELESFKTSPADQLKQNFYPQKTPSNNSFNQEPKRPAPEIKQKIILNLGENCQPELLKKISEILSSADKGSCKIIIASGGNNKKLETAFRIDFNITIQQALSELIGAENITKIGP